MVIAPVSSVLGDMELEGVRLGATCCAKRYWLPIKSRNDSLNIRGDFGLQIVA